jgi:glycosyltransferase involved in cell wall biosynthesis
MSAVASARSIGIATRVVRVAHLVTHPIPYFAPLYRELARRQEIDLTVYFYSDASTRAVHLSEGFGHPIRWATRLLDGYRWRLLPSAAGAPIPEGILRRPNWDVAREVATRRYDVVWAHGYADATTWLVLWAARAAGSRLLIREEATLLEHRPLGKRVLKGVGLRALLSGAGGLYIGEHNRRFLRRYGVPEERLFPARYCVDNDFLRGEAARLGPRRHELRRSFGINDGAPVVLFTGRLVAKKQPLMLLDAFARVRAQTPCWLLVAGDGPLRDEVERRHLPGVRLAGFLDENELPRAYAAADLLVLPSGWDETWGLVVNEALNFALPVVVTDKVGCAADLVRDGWNGRVVSHRSAGDLAEAIGELVADGKQRRVFGERGRRLVEDYSLRACADGIVAACLAVTR